MSTENADLPRETPPSLLDSVVPVLILVAMLSASVLIFGSDSSYGPNQIALLLATGIAGVIGVKNGYRWQTIETAMINGIAVSLGAILILLVVGALIGTWLLAGIVPTLIYYGLELLDPAFFYAASCVICAVVAISIGSSWTTAATVGVALIGVASGMGMSQAITAGAIISGAYFGDKLSPLSETTNLAPAVAETDLFEHIRYMLWTTVPSVLLALLLFTAIGLSATDLASSQNIAAMQQLLQGEFVIGWPMLIPLVVLLCLAIAKVPALPTLVIGALLGGVWAMIFQQQAVATMGARGDFSNYGGIVVVWQTLFAGVALETDNAELNNLLSGGGMASMLNTVWLIICALAFGAVMERVGLLKRAVDGFMRGARATGDVITRTMLTCVATNLVTADQYMAIVMPGRMYKQEFRKRGLHQLNLSRSLEDGGTLTSPLIPWNTCGAYMHSVLAVHPFEYIGYAFFNFINPVLAIIYAFIGIKILRLEPPASYRQASVSAASERSEPSAQ